jgi:ectoine hydroxylase-related dioxygenase (phytanoyl-CoA dioxygenase family)
MSIYVTPGTVETGELRVLPGSHTTSAPFIDERTSGDLGIGIPMAAGDVSLHITDVMHASMPPTSVQGPHRVAVLLGFSRPIAHTHDEGVRHYIDALLGAEDGQISRLGG